MTEDEARDWIASRYGSDKLARLEAYVTLLLNANRTQNLISKATEPQIWVRHILDSAQLERLAPEALHWLDIGSGAGLPGIVLSILTERPILMVEPRRKRVDFLRGVVDNLSLNDAAIVQSTVERLASRASCAITARAYAALDEIFSTSSHLADTRTTWILPKGRNAQAELAEAQQTWQGVFHVEQSLTNREAKIVVATSVRPR